MAGPTANAERLAETLAGLDLERVVEITLSEIGRRTPLQRRILRDCYENANGFEAFHLMTSSGIGGDLVAHVWQPPSATLATAGAATDIHDHRWDLTSFVVQGQLEMRCHEPRAGSSHLRYEHRRDRRWGHLFEPLAPGGVRQIGELRLEAGMMYALGSSVLHDVRSQPGTITIMLRGREQRATTNVFTTRPKPTAEVIRQPRLALAYVCQRLELIAGALTGAGSTLTEIIR